jgi:hypothetical protein
MYFYIYNFKLAAWPPIFFLISALYRSIREKLAKENARHIYCY